MNIQLFTLTVFISLVFGMLGGFIGVQYIGFNRYQFVASAPSTLVKPSIKSLETTITSLVKKASISVVSIVVTQDLDAYKSDHWGFFQYKVGSNQKQVGGGTGFFISDNGIIITNKHVLSNLEAQYTVILNDGTEFNASVLDITTDKDIAFLQIDSSTAHFSPLQFNKSQHLRLGQFSIAIGNALSEFNNSISLGIISGTNRTIQDNYTYITGLIQTDTAIHPGNSGGPLLGINGNVLGINTAIINGGHNIGFSIPLTQDEVNMYIKKISILNTK